jgi:hypothetical protein
MRMDAIQKRLWSMAHRFVINKSDSGDSVSHNSLPPPRCGRGTYTS